MLADDVSLLTNFGTFSTHRWESATLNPASNCAVSGSDSGIGNRSIPSAVLTANPPPTPGSTATIVWFDFIRLVLFLVTENSHLLGSDSNR